jgi:glycosyltransferase involved in cell wall biosynthesis
MVRHKRIDLFLKAAASLCEIFPLLSFVLVGGGEREGRYKKMAQDLRLEEKIVFTGSMISVEDTLSSFALGLLPSENEGFPNTLLEYLSAGIPVVVSSIPQNMEVIEADREGKVAPVGDVGALVSSAAEILSNRALAKKMGIMATRRVKRFSLDHTMKVLLSYYRDFLGDKVPSRSL